MYIVKIAKIRFAYFTPIMLTRQIAYNIASGAGQGAATQQINLTSVAERQKQQEYAPDELLIAAVPTFGGRIPVLDPPLLHNLHGNGSPAVVVVTYGARGYDDTLVEMQDLLTQQGFVVIGGAAFVTMHALSPQVGKGRPNTQDLLMARSFGSQIREKLQEMPQPAALNQLPGNRPYKPAPPPSPLAPSTDEQCVLCMQCYRWCPVDAIPYNDPNKTHADKCILCHGCIVRCPVKARTVTDSAFQGRVSQLEENFGAHQPMPETFL